MFDELRFLQWGGVPDEAPKVLHNIVPLQKIGTELFSFFGQQGAVVAVVLQVAQIDQPKGLWRVTVDRAVISTEGNIRIELKA